MPTWHWDPQVGDFATTWETSPRHWEGHHEYCDWFICLWGGSSCIQLIRSVHIAFDLRKSLSLFLWVLEYPVMCKSYFLPKVVTPLAWIKTKSLSQRYLSPLLTVTPRVRYRFNHLCILPCLSDVMYTHSLQSLMDDYSNSHSKPLNFVA